MQSLTAYWSALYQHLGAAPANAMIIDECERLGVPLEVARKGVRLALAQLDLVEASKGGS